MIVYSSSKERFLRCCRNLVQVAIMTLIFVYSLQESPKSHVVKHVNPFLSLYFTYYLVDGWIYFEKTMGQGKDTFCGIFIKKIIWNFHPSAEIFTEQIKCVYEQCVYIHTKFLWNGKTWEIATFTRNKQKNLFLDSSGNADDDCHSNGRWKIAQPFGNDSFSFTHSLLSHKIIVLVIQKACIASRKSTLTAHTFSSFFHIKLPLFPLLHFSIDELVHKLNKLPCFIMSVVLCIVNLCVETQKKMEIKLFPAVNIAKRYIKANATRYCKRIERKLRKEVKGMKIILHSLEKVFPSSHIRTHMLSYLQVPCREFLFNNFI